MSLVRRIAIVFHRYAGLTMAVFLLDIALTGAAIAFAGELDGWLNADVRTVPADGAPRLDPLVLRDRAQALEPRARVDVLPLGLGPGDAFVVELSPRVDPETQKPFELASNQLSLDPRSGDPIARWKVGGVIFDRRAIVYTLVVLHYTLGIESETVVKWLFGIVALAWTVDCFAAFYLTLPSRGRVPPEEPGAPGRIRAFLRRWRPAWWVKWGAGFHRVNFDLHRALGLWTWAMFFLFAWTGVGFLLGEEVYQPVMRVAFDLRSPSQEAMERLPRLDPPLETPLLSWTAARDLGDRLSREAAARHGATVSKPVALFLDREHGLYQHIAEWTRGGERDSGRVLFDAGDGTAKLELPPAFAASEPFGARLNAFLFQLHMGMVGGLPVKILVSIMGVVVAVGTVSGVVIWWKKRSGRRRAAALREVAA
jgi:uncharacterized iron-regulated membrane protein